MSQAPTFDTWLKEFEEAMQLADDIAARIKERDLIVASGGDSSRLVSATRRKITVLGTNIDRLESLLQNPPAKPSLNEKELYRRQDMLLGIRYKTKQMAASLSTSQPQNRSSLLQQTSGKQPVETSITMDRDTYGLIGVQNRIMQEQDKDLGNLESTVPSTKHIALAVNEELDLHTHLLDDPCQDSNGTNSHLKNVQKKSPVLSEQAGSSCSLRSPCLLILGVLVLLLVVWTIIKIF